MGDRAHVQKSPCGDAPGQPSHDSQRVRIHSPRY
ncbi:hypothetical protein LEMLEM_LOCUS20884 [Lemmus lemmus]